MTNFESLMLTDDGQIKSYSCKQLEILNHIPWSLTKIGATPVATPFVDLRKSEKINLDKLILMIVPHSHRKIDI